jgi:hypothetical protein
MLLQGDPKLSPGGVRFRGFLSIHGPGLQSGRAWSMVGFDFFENFIASSRYHEIMSTWRFI